MSYTYAVGGSKGQKAIAEREPRRSILIETPDTYAGSDGSSLVLGAESETTKSYFVNGFLQVSDGTFYHGF